MEQLYRLAKALYHSYDIPIKVKVQGQTPVMIGTRLKEEINIQSEYDTNIYKIPWTEGINLFMHQTGVAWCHVQLPERKTNIELGPVNVTNVNPLMIYYTGEENKRPSSSLLEFLEVISVLYCYCTGNETFARPDTILDEITEMFNKKIVVQQSTDFYEQTLEKDIREMQMRLELLMRGYSNRIKEINQENTYIQSLLQFCVSEASAEGMLTSCLYLSMHFAVLGGVPTAEAGAMVSFYRKQFNNLKNKEESVGLYNTILEDFAAIVEQCQSSGYSKEIAKVIQIIKRNLNKRLTVEYIAGEISFSQYHLMHWFKSETGMSVGEYIQHEKINHAKLLLLYTTYPISYISEYLRYSSQSHFTSAFKKGAGFTPQEYRSSSPKKTVLSNLYNQ